MPFLTKEQREHYQAHNLLDVSDAFIDYEELTSIVYRLAGVYITLD